MSHPALGLPPRDMTAGFPDAAATLLHERARVAARALEVAVSLDESLTERHDELALRRLLRDAEVLVERLGAAVGANDPALFREFADMSAPLYRRRQVPMDDLVTLLEGVRRAVASVLPPDALESAGRALDAGVEAYHDWRRFAGDTRRRNALLHAIYRGG